MTTVTERDPRAAAGVQKIRDVLATGPAPVTVVTATGTGGIARRCHSRAVP